MSFSGRCGLVVEGEEPLAALAAGYFGRDGYDVTPTQDSLSALELARVVQGDGRPVALTLTECVESVRGIDYRVGQRT